MSFQISIPQNRRASSRFIGKVRRALQKGLAENPEIKRADIAKSLNVHRSVITRQLGGTKDMSLGRVAELAWSMGYEPHFFLQKVESSEGSNTFHESAPALTCINVTTSTSSGSIVRDVSEREIETA